MMIVEERVELRMEGLDLCLRRSADEAMALSELHGMAEHVQLRERLVASGATPVLVDAVEKGAKHVQIRLLPVAVVQQPIMQNAHPPCELLDLGLGCRRNAGGCCGCIQHARGAILLDPACQLRPVELVNVREPASAS